MARSNIVKRVLFVVLATGLLLGVQAVTRMAGAVSAAPPVSGFTLAPGSASFDSVSGGGSSPYQQVALPIQPGGTKEPGADWTFQLPNTFQSGDAVQIAVTPATTANQCTTNPNGTGADWVGFTSSAVPTVTVDPGNGAAGAGVAGADLHASLLAIGPGTGTTDAAPTFSPGFAFSGTSFPPAPGTPPALCSGVTNLLSLTLTDSATGSGTDAPWTVTVSGVQFDAGAGADYGYVTIGVAYLPSGAAAQTILAPGNTTPPSNAIVGAVMPNFPNASVLPRNDDGSTGSVNLPFPIDFFGNSFSSVFVNNNGNLTFAGQNGTYTPGSIAGAGQPIIAPFWGDVMTTPGGPASGDGITTFGSGMIGGRQAFMASWPGVDCYRTTNGGLDYFQVILIDRGTSTPNQVGDDFDIVFNYSRISWETGQASGGDGNCLGGASAHAGWSDGGFNTLELTGSGVNGAFLDGGPDSLVAGSDNSPLQGQYIYHVQNGGNVGHSVSGQVTSSSNNQPVSGARVQVCATGANPVCGTSNTGATGLYGVSGIPDGTYNVLANPPFGSNSAPVTVGPFTLPCTGDQTVPVGGSTVQATCSAGNLNVPVALTVPTPPPDGTSIDTNNVGTTDGNIPIVNWLAGTQITTTGCVGGSGVGTLTAPLPAGFTPAQVRPWFTQNADSTFTGPTPPTTWPDNGVATADQHGGIFTETPPGSGIYTGTLPPAWPLHGDTTIRIVTTCGTGDAQRVTNNTFNIYIDPSGTVVDQNDAPIAGATVTLLQQVDGSYSVVPNGSAVMSPANRNNPDTTNGAGQFGWDTVAGSYEVKAAAPGCSTRTTDPFTIPPPVTGMVIQLTCGGAPAPGGGGTPLIVTGLSPSSGPATGGTTVTIAGSGFPTSTGAVQVAFGSLMGTNVSCTDSACTAVSPASTSSGQVPVTLNGQPAGRFTFVPAVTAVSPSGGPASGGTPVTITGAGFSTTPGAPTSFAFGSSPASNVACTSSSSCTATAPAGSGPVDVIASVVGLSSASTPADQFTYTSSTGSPPSSGGSGGGGGSPEQLAACSADANSAYVCALFQSLLYRPADAVGLTTFVGELNGGASRPQVAASIMRSAEYKAVLVQGWYHSFLGRPADQTGLTADVAALTHGTSDEAVEAGILGSPEFLARAGGAPSDFVAALYQVLLGRAPDTGSLAWVGVLGAGMSRSQVAAGILTAPEGRAHLVDGWFMTYLHRHADPGALATFTAVLKSGGTDEAVIAQLVGSNEYFADVT